MKGNQGNFLCIYLNRKILSANNRVTTMKFLPIILILLSVHCFSQDFVSIYKDYLPDPVTKNKTYSVQVDLAFKAYSDIHPDLIYYYIRYLEQKLGESYGNDYFIKNFPDIKRMYEAQHYESLRHLQEAVKEKHIDKTLMGLCLDYIDDYIDEEIHLKKVPELGYNTDKNLLNFFVVKYYTHNEETEYDKSVNYENSRREIEQKKLSGYRDMQNNPAAYSRDDLKNLIMSIDLIDTNQSSYRIDAASIIVNVMEHYYDSNNLFSGFEIGAGYSFHNDYMFTGNFIYNTPLYSGSDVKRKFQMSSLFLSVKYKISLSKYYSLFNMINVRASGGYGLINHSIEGENLGFWNQGNVDGVSNRSEIFEFTTNNIKLKNAGYIQADITVPVFYFKELLSIDIGAGMNVLFTNYEVTYEYEYRKYESEFLGPKIISTENGSGTDEKMTSSTLKFFPVASITLYTYSPFILHLMFDMHAGSIEMGLKL